MIQTRKVLLIFCLLILGGEFLTAQQQIKIMTYNLLNYDGTDTTTRNPYFRTVISSVSPDILVVQEITTQTQVNNFRTKILSGFGESYSAGTFIFNPSPGTNNALYYKTLKFSFISNTAIKTVSRDINEFKVKNLSTGDTMRIFSVHLKADTGTVNENKRAAEVDSLRKFTNNLPAGSNYIVMGDFNIYKSSEPAYQKLLNQTGSGYFLDAFNLTGTWNQYTYRQHHTQSTRVRSFGNGSTGGLDDRFDMILMSPQIMSSGGITYIPGTYTPYGNDGNHYNDSINQPPNNAVGQTIANALHYASDHLPVFATFLFEPRDTSITLNLTALIHGFYNGTTVKPDTVKVFLRQAFSPFAKIDSVKIFLNSSGFGTGKFLKTPNGTYYIVVTHRNGLETWSRVGGESLAQGTSISYDFTTASSKAYGNNLVQKGTKWCIYNGDVNQDGIVDLTDLLSVDNDNYNFVTGYVITDTNGDTIVDVSDLSIVDGNSLNYVTKIVP